MKVSRAFLPTLRQAPSEAEVISHILLLRAGMIRRVAGGIYEFLPLGLRSLQKVERIVREELNAAGCQEVQMPHMVPAEFWQESGRWQKYGKELLRIRDRHDREYCFGPTHEEVICDMVRNDVRSYRSLPLNLFQIQTKFRDEIRPRFGLMRGREFLMKDGYSFHATQEDLDREYLSMRQTYLTIFKRCGLDCRAVDADTGAIGGNSSHEFMVLAETGEDVIASCESCEYAANLEKAKYRLHPTREFTKDVLSEVETPGKKSIEDVSTFLKISPSQMIKTLVYKADAELVGICLAGHRTLNDVKLKNALGCEDLRLATDDEIWAGTGAPMGYLGPIGMPKPVRFLYDMSVLEIADGVTGANKKNAHLQHVNVVRDCNMTADNSTTFDLASVNAADTCPVCADGKLKLLRGIEVGHIFKLGLRYSEPMKVTYLDADGQEKPAIMGTYGIGVTRTLASSVEQNHDDKGIIWPLAIAPYSVHLLTMGTEPELVAKAQVLYDDLNKAGIDVLWDDRDERAGVKFNDADLIGLPLQIILGKKGLEKGELEYKIRRNGTKGVLPLANAFARINELMKTLS